MLSVTKLFHFEAAHAIHGYPGNCKNIHGHSYQLEVTVCSGRSSLEYIPAPGFVMDFRELKKQVTGIISAYLDHKLILSKKYLDAHPGLSLAENGVSFEEEPSAENLLIFLKKALCEILPANIELQRLKLWETRDSYAELTLEK